MVYARWLASVSTGQTAGGGRAYRAETRVLQDQLTADNVDLIAGTEWSVRGPTLGRVGTTVNSWSHSLYVLFLRFNCLPYCQ